jgi:hypothetical protein
MSLQRWLAMGQGQVPYAPFSYDDDRFLKMRGRRLTNVPAVTEVARLNLSTARPQQQLKKSKGSEKQVVYLLGRSQ